MSDSPQIIRLEKFIVTGLSIRTKNSDEFNPETAKLPGLWQQFLNTDLVNNPNIYGVYSNYVSDVNDFYTVTVGVDLKNVEAHSSSVVIREGNYLAFNGQGPIPAAVVETWQKIWSFFESNSEYERSYVSDFEQYNSPEDVTIYIGVK